MENEHDRRDIFAAFALMGYIANQWRTRTQPKEIAAIAFEVADEMIKLSTQK